MSPDRLFQIIHEEDELLVVNKPAGLVCHPTKTDALSSLISRVRLYLGPKYSPHLINRLDRETSGITLIAKTAEAAKKLRNTFVERDVQKVYAAVIHGWPIAQEGWIDAPLGRDVTSRIAIKDCVRSDGAPSFTRYRVLKRFKHSSGALSFLEVVPLTGRKHQIRIHLSHLGHPIVGDKIYGGDEDAYLNFVRGSLTDAQRLNLITPHHALHAGEIEFPWRDQRLRFEVQPESWFVELIGQQKNRLTN